MARTVALEQDPNTGQWIVKGGGKFYPVGEGEEKPGYVTWEGQLTAAFKEIEVLIEQLYVLSETSAAGLRTAQKWPCRKVGQPFRRLMMAPLAKGKPH